MAMTTLVTLQLIIIGLLILNGLWYFLSTRKITNSINSLKEIRFKMELSAKEFDEALEKARIRDSKILD